MVARHRSQVGDRFTEGARLLWLVLEGNQWTLAALAEAADVSKPTLFRYLYGDREMRLGTAQRLEVLTGVPAASWAQPPTEPFAPSRAPDAPSSTPALPDDTKPSAA